jgi:transcriptional regulator with XRE-family HTH domain
MAEKMDISLVSYSKIERGITELSVKRLFEIAKILEVDVAELLGIEVLDSKSLNKALDLEQELIRAKKIVDAMTVVILRIIEDEEEKEKENTKLNIINQIEKEHDKPSADSNLWDSYIFQTKKN